MENWERGTGQDRGLHMLFIYGLSVYINQPSPQGRGRSMSPDMAGCYTRYTMTDTSLAHQLSPKNFQT